MYNHRYRGNLRRIDTGSHEFLCFDHPPLPKGNRWRAIGILSPLPGATGRDSGTHLTVSFTESPPHSMYRGV